MRFVLCIAAAYVITLASVPGSSAESIVKSRGAEMERMVTTPFPDMTDRSLREADIESAQKSQEPVVTPAIWPFGEKDESDNAEVKPKSSRKAFFLSFLLPGLGETYVGSKRGILFLGIEAVSWWLYMTNTNEGNDLEDDFQRFANTKWHYTDTTDSQGNEIDTNYWKWVQYHFRQIGLPDDIDTNDHALIDEQLEQTVQNSRSSIFGYSIHNLPPKKTQQYYEMIGKYPQFVYGWEDIGDPSTNPTIRNEDGSINYNEAIQNINSPLRAQYENMRDDSNKKLKAGQRGIHIMLLNRVVSAIHAARLAYHHNQKLDSELSMINIQFTEKYILDNRVPMLMVTKKF